jgi:alkanesulfonate monooxygenase SsuD/methylene tetrahydromethanopterin reductase-like flavin-dependent oxidoreductase (luciferase family)
VTLMVSLGYLLTSAELTPRELLQQAKWAEEAGFERRWISHHDPWNHEHILGGPWPGAGRGR